MSLVDTAKTAYQHYLDCTTHKNGSDDELCNHERRFSNAVASMSRAERDEIRLFLSDLPLAQQARYMSSHHILGT
jgi:hypothetical protein